MINEKMLKTYPDIDPSKLRLDDEQPATYDGTLSDIDSSVAIEERI